MFKKVKIILLGVLILLVLNIAFAGERWKARVDKDQFGTYKALVQCYSAAGNIIETRLVGTYERKRDAKKAAKKEAKELNKEAEED